MPHYRRPRQVTRINLIRSFYPPTETRQIEARYARRTGQLVTTGLILFWMLIVMLLTVAVNWNH